MQHQDKRKGRECYQLYVSMLKNIPMNLWTATILASGVRGDGGVDDDDDDDDDYNKIKILMNECVIKYASMRENVLSSILFSAVE